MKIGIITFHRPHNYGALLQAFALKTYLENENHQVEFIDYWPEYHDDEYKLLSIKKLRKYSNKGKVKFLVLFLLGISRIIKRRNGFLHFMHNKLGLSTKPLFNNKSDITGDYDCIFFGSDQIWRKHNYEDFKGFDSVYFGDLPNVHTKYLVSYAASMGIVNLDVADNEFLKKHLQDFEAISVREENICKAIDNLGFMGQIVLDPVFLIRKEEWIKLVEHTRNNGKSISKRKKYLLFYQLTPSREAEILVENICKEQGLYVVIIGPEVNSLLFSNKYIQTASPEEFLELIMNCEVVVSTSFHGVAFSIIFEKQFFYLDKGENSDRVNTLLKSLHLESRFLKEAKEAKYTKEIDYAKATFDLLKIRSNSVQFITNSIDRKAD